MDHTDLPPLLGPAQLFHTAANKFYADTTEGWLFHERYLKQAVPLTTDAQLLKFGSDAVQLEGLFIELGVCTGKTINFIAALNPKQKIYGFDSFAGLPEDWVKGNHIIAQGSFAVAKLPEVLHNVVLVKGWFADTLPSFTKAFAPTYPIAFLHIDSDIYASAATAFTLLAPRIQTGTILVFDELYNYPGFDKHEFKALQEFLEQSSLQARYLAYNIYHEQVAVQLF